MASYDGGQVKVIAMSPDILRMVMDKAGHVRDDEGEPHGWAVKAGSSVIAVAQDQESAVVVLRALRSAGLQGASSVEEIKGKSR
jgi:hypothetical protein